MSLLHRIKVVYRHPLETVMCVLLCVAVLVAFAQVVFRYLLHHSLSWSEELARFIFIWLSMLAAAYGFKTKSHFALMFVVKRFGEHWRRLISILVVAVLSAFLILFVLKSLDLILIVTINQVAPGTQIPIAVPYSAAPVGGALMLYYILRNGWVEFRSPQKTY